MTVLVSVADRELAVRARAGDRQALDLLYRRHSPSILRMSIRLLGGRHDAEDAMHDTFVHALRRLPDLRDADAIAGWMMRIAVNEARGKLRRRGLLRRLGMAPELEPEIDRAAEPQVGPELATLLVEIGALLEKLPRADRIAWQLRHVEGHRLEEVAALTGVSLATTKRRLQRADAFLAACLEAP